MDRKSLYVGLRAAGYKVTPQRRAVIEAMLKADRSMTPGELHAALAGGQPGIGLVTVYRTLGILNSLGLLCQFQPEGAARSFKAGPGEHHHHLVCRGCGDVVNFSGLCPEEIASALETETGFRITDHRLEFTGYCRGCQAGTDSSSKDGE